MPWYVVDTDGYKHEFHTSGMAQAYIDEHGSECASPEPIYADGRSAGEIGQQLRQRLAEEDPNWKHKNFRRAKR